MNTAEYTRLGEVDGVNGIELAEEAVATAVVVDDDDDDAAEDAAVDPEAEARLSTEVDALRAALTLPPVLRGIMVLDLRFRNEGCRWGDGGAG